MDLGQLNYVEDEAVVACAALVNNNLMMEPHTGSAAVLDLLVDQVPIVYLVGDINLIGVVEMCPR